ncbi:MAG: transcription elongation factor GreA [Pyrinomonadaceae bacterium]|nr:transcription elongation factor GreA [Pyrinomonadaceae bacterium]
MTEEIKKKLLEDLKTLDYELRVDLPREIKKAVEHGDLRENSEYKAALERQEIVRAQVATLRKRIGELDSIDLSKIPTDSIAYGSIIELYDVDKDEVVTYRLVMPEESDIPKGFISTVSPIGKSLMGKQEGDDVKIETPAGTRNFEVQKLKTLHDQK